MNDAVKKVLWWLCLLVAPATLIAIELYHPAGFTQNPGMYQYLSKPEPYDPRFQALGYPGPHWWFTLHMIQTPMVALVAVGLWLLVARVRASDGLLPLALAWLSALSTFVFLIYYTALDSIGGAGLARSILITKQLSASGQLTPMQMLGVQQVLNATWTDHWVGGVGSFVSLLGSWAVFVAAVLAAVALFLSRRAPWAALILLVAFGWELQVSHTMPHGPIAFGLLILSAGWIWLRRMPLKNSVPGDGSHPTEGKGSSADGGQSAGGPRRRQWCRQRWAAKRKSRLFFFCPVIRRGIEQLLCPTSMGLGQADRILLGWRVAPHSVREADSIFKCRRERRIT